MITTIVGFAISMAFLFLMLSAACSAIQEIIANFFRWRSTTLEHGLSGILMSQDFQKAIYELPLIQGLFSSGLRKNSPKRSPSYIPSSTLALSILQVAADKKLDLKTPSLAPDHTLAATEKLLVSLLRDCNTVAEQRKRLEEWFDSSMERVSGWYKRKAHAWIWIIGLVLCSLLNADAISLSKRFWNDQTLREAIATEATEYVKSTPKSEAVGDDNEDLQKSVGRLNLLRENLPGVPLGWCRADGKLLTALDKPQAPANSVQATCWPDLLHPRTTAVQVALDPTDPRLTDLSEWTWWLGKIVGIIATVLAISQGAPFWFDLLQKVVNLRLAGAPPETSKEKK